MNSKTRSTPVIAAFRLLFVALTGLTVGACSKGDHHAGSTSDAGNQAARMESAVATLAPTQGNKVTGTVAFVREPNGIRVTARIQSLAEGDHGFHVHEKGDCSAPDGSSAGGHFNPTNLPHAGRDAQKRHVGDLGNLTADANGVASVNFVDSHLELSGPNSIIGKAVIVHAGPDDFTSQPSGNAGGRVACGVIESK